MPLKVSIIPDKFKGTLTAHEAADAIARGWSKARPDDSLELLPMSDGGDGFGEVLGQLLNAKIQTTWTVDAAHRPCRAHWWWEPQTKTAIIESARVIGLAMLPPGKFNPFALDTFGLGKVLQAAARKGAQRCYVGIGGSATNDGGFGMARALGWQFFDAQGKTIEHWPQLVSLSSIRAPKQLRLFPQLKVAMDVQNPLLGKNGCSRIYGPQKGLRDFASAEAALRRLAFIVRRDLKKNFAGAPGAGAAGGLGFGLMTFLGAQGRSGFDMFAANAQVPRRLRGVDLLITGEGAIDASTMMGKGVGELVRLCGQSKKPCVGLAGYLGGERKVAKHFVKLRGLTQITSVKQARSRPAYWLERLAEMAARDILIK